MKFTAEHEALRKTVRDFVEKEINPHCDEWEEAGEFPIHDPVSYTHLTLPTIYSV